MELLTVTTREDAPKPLSGRVDLPGAAVLGVAATVFLVWFATLLIGAANVDILGLTVFHLAAIPTLATLLLAGIGLEIIWGGLPPLQELPLSLST